MRAAALARERLDSLAATGTLLVDPAPDAVCALRSAIVVFVATWSWPSITMLYRVRESARRLAAGVPCPALAAMDAESEAGTRLAQRLGVCVLGWGETCWIRRGAVLYVDDAIVSEAALAAYTLDLALENVATAAPGDARARRPRS